MTIIPYNSLPKPPMGSPLNVGHWSTDGLVVYYPFINSDRLIDYSNSKNDGTITGGTWVAGGLDLDGAGQIDVGNDIFSGWEQFTVIMSVKFDTLSNSDGLIGAWSAGAGRKVLVRFHASGDLDFFTVADGVVENDTGLTFTTGVWMHLAFVYDGALTLAYKDGIVGPTTAAQTGPIATYVAQPVYFGNDVGSAANGMDGQFRHISIYDRALTPSEVKQLYINPYLPVQQEPIWLLSSSAVPGVTMAAHYYRYLMQGIV